MFALLVTAFISAIWLVKETREPETETRFLTQDELASIKDIQNQNVVEEKLVIDVEGQVANPGVIEVESGISMLEAIQKAGGFTKNADLYYIQKNINLASIVEDRQKIYIPSIEERTNTSQANSSGEALVNINTATSAELDELPGVGPSTAEKIIEARPFDSIDDIKEISGIGDALFEKIKDKITI